MILLGLILFLVPLAIMLSVDQILPWDNWFAEYAFRVGTPIMLIGIILLAIGFISFSTSPL